MKAVNLKPIQPQLQTLKLGNAQLPHISLLQGVTPIEVLENYAESLKFDYPILIKREDQTSSLYGGNKVRNLEFIIAEAIKQNAKSLKTLIPYGSNFTASLASESQRIGIQVNLHQFVAHKNKQTISHAKYAESHKAKLFTYSGKLGPIRAGTSFLRDTSSFTIAPGGSTTLGASGHLRALLECVNQLRSTRKELPDFIIVGTGTCGNTAGILAGITMLGLKTKLIGVKCADAIVCNRRRAIKLANQTLAFLGSQQRVAPQQFTLVEAPGHIKYGLPSQIAIAEAKIFTELENIQLDLTYTSKVIATLASLRKTKKLNSKDKVLYWHTYSDKAFKY